MLLYCVVQTVEFELAGVVLNAMFAPEIATDNVPVVVPKNACPYIEKSTFVPSVTASTVATPYLVPGVSIDLTRNQWFVHRKS